MSKFVYFIKPVGLPGPIKIGSSREPQNRLAQLADWSPWPLEILVMIPGTLELERRLHSCFSHAHRHREWFEPDTELVAGITALKEGLPVEKAFDLDKITGSIRSRPANYGTRKSSQYREWWGYLCRLRHAAKKSETTVPVEAYQILRASRCETTLTIEEKAYLDRLIYELKKTPRSLECKRHVPQEERAGTVDWPTQIKRPQ